MAKKIDPELFIKESRTGVIIDVRTPAEFESGHIPGANSLPLFTDQQRVVVGTIYKQQGHDPAVQRGLEFVGPRLAEIAATAKSIAQGKPIYLYCWRGGMRSGSVAWLLETAGMQVVLLGGGYKAYRSSFERMIEREPWRFLLLSGMTGCGKTKLLKILARRGEQVLDLEGIANHRGSAFGGIGKGEQPTTEHFINKLHDAFRAFDPARPVWTESESMRVGKVYIPHWLYKRLDRDSLIEVSMDREQRLDQIVAEYGALPFESLVESFCRISRRMGPEKATEAVKLIQRGDLRGAASLGLDYYDKSYSRTRAADREVIEFVADGTNLERSANELIDIKNQLYAN